MTITIKSALFLQASLMKTGFKGDIRQSFSLDNFADDQSQKLGSVGKILNAFAPLRSIKGIVDIIGMGRIYNVRGQTQCVGTVA